MRNIRNIRATTSPSGQRLGAQACGTNISVVIPVVNEAATITSVIACARSNPLVNEVIVVDDGSIDGTPELAAGAGELVITSSLLGKGVSMEEGMLAAKNETILYLDGDLSGLDQNIVEKMTAPILSHAADFVKARFSRSAGRVTILTARPLLRTYFPELSHFEQPLSGIMAARKSLLQKLRFENDYGVDIGLLIDAAEMKARLAEVDIGRLAHDSQPLSVLGEMATQVARAILERAARWGRLRLSFIRHVQEQERHRRADLPAVLSRVPDTERLALFDMDGVVLDGRYIVTLAEYTGRCSQLSEWLDRFDISSEERTRRISAIFAGLPLETFEQVAREMPLMPGAVETVVGLRKLGFRVGLVTDCFQVVSHIVRRRIFADFSFANVMRFQNGKATGRVAPSPGLSHRHGCPEHSCCKANVLRHIREKLNLPPERVLAVGDGENDICMLKEAGVSVAFRPKSHRVVAAAQYAAHDALTDVLAIVTGSPALFGNSLSTTASMSDLVAETE